MFLHRHIELLTENMAIEVKNLILKDNLDFSLVAKNVSICEETKGKGGDMGWSPNPNQELPTDSLYPVELMNAALSMNKGDIKIVKTLGQCILPSLGSVASWHIIQLIDMSVKIAPRYAITFVLTWVWCGSRIIFVSQCRLRY